MKLNTTSTTLLMLAYVIPENYQKGFNVRTLKLCGFKIKLEQASFLKGINHQNEKHLRM